jgi:saccharopine dehydrogenase-like NADP-dependent oxidoreductase
MQHFDSRQQVAEQKDSPGQNKVNVLGEPEKNVLILGAGKVAGSCAEYLGRSTSTTVAVASQFEDEAMAVAKHAARGKAVTCDLSSPGEKLRRLIEDADVVVSLLPAPMHAMIAEECISLKTDLVTASYESDQMRALQAGANEAGVAILNEVGLDPGMDHMSAMKIIDDVHSRGGKVTSFSSVCGGLPAPEAANNPMLYKFSWSPMGVMRASQNDATFRRDGHIVQVDGADLLASSEPFYAWKSLNLECLPNRDSLVYGEKYGIEGASTIFRGTLRYRGFSSLLHVFKNMGILDDVETGASTWHDTLENLRSKRGFHDLRTFVLSCAGNDKDLASRVYNCMLWLGLKIAPVSDQSSVVKSFCDLLEQHLQFEEGERDMVLMHHDIKAIFDDGSDENHSCSLQIFGDDNMTAMSKTVGYTAAIGTKLILDGDISKKGLLLPTNKDVYIPSLGLLKKEGVVFEEQVHIHDDYDDQVV